MIKRLLTDELKNYPFEVILGTKSIHGVTDKDGYFEIMTEGNIPGFIAVHPSNGESVRSSVFSISDQATFGIISDIDDTIMKTGVSSKFKWRVIFNTFFLNPWRRDTFELTPELFVQLNKGDGTKANPIFYVSNSPWNLFQYLRQYILHKNFPDGILVLRDMGIGWLRRKKLIQERKFDEVERILNSCPDLEFILFGDSAEIDTDIYLAIKDKYPKRILMIYIREIPKSRRKNHLKQLMSSYKSPEEILLFTEIDEVFEDLRAKNILPKKDNYPL